QPNDSPYKKETEQVKGDPDAGFKEAEVVSEGIYGCPVITHCCLESHGSIAEWTDNDHLFSHISTQNVSGLAGQYAQALKIPEANVHVHQDHVGGGFGSKFGIDRWRASSLPSSLACISGAHTPRRFKRKPAASPFESCWSARRSLKWLAAARR